MMWLLLFCLCLAKGDRDFAFLSTVALAAQTFVELSCDSAKTGKTPYSVESNVIPLYETDHYHFW